ncbi:MAG: hypothetical protein M3Q97_03660, partial [Bacteroidota bacterium]|nr:hypothetical protein [Bacteroidota bacterium]
MYIIHWKKVTLTLALIIILGTIQASAQGGYRRMSDYARTIHFGIAIGTNFSTLKYERSSNFYTQDTFKKVSMLTYP